MEMHENRQFESEVYGKLQAAECEAETTSVRYSSCEILNAMKEAIVGG